MRKPRVRLGAVLALAIAAGFIVWLVVGRGDGSSTSTPSTQGPAGSSTGPVAVTAAGLKTLSRSAHEPIYWARAKRGYTYELTRTSDGKVYVRYLPTGVKVGDKRANFLIVVTYPFKNAYAALKAVAHGQGQRIPGGGLALVHNGYPESVHVAYPHEDYQVEVYDPSPNRSLAVAISGLVRPVA